TLVYVKTTKEKKSTSSSFVPYMLEGKEKMDSLRSQIGHMLNTEDQLQKARIEEKERKAVLTPMYSLVISILALTIIFLTFFRLRKELALQRKMRRDISDAKTFLDSVLDTSQNGIVVYEAIRNGNGNQIADFRILLANRSAEAQAKLDTPDYKGKTLLELYPDARSKGIFDRFKKVVETGASLEYD